MDLAIQSALIGAGTVAALSLIKDICIPFVQFRYSQKEKLKSLTERYAYPLGMSAVGLFYRLREMIVFQRCDYLQEERQSNIFNKYKYISSIYRLASLIGWIRALELESSHLVQRGNNTSSHLVDLVSNFKKSLADGPHVEVDIVKGLAGLWSIPLPKDENKINIIANKCDQVRNCTLSNQEQQIEKEDIIKVVKIVADNLCLSANTSELSDDIIKETAARAYNILTPKQHWIYRDWQNAIGDTMIEKSQTPIREFDIIGYASFEDLFEENNKWIKRTELLFLDVDFGINQYDYRTQQLSSILSATARLILEINKLDIDSKPFTEINISDAANLSVPCPDNF